MKTMLEQNSQSRLEAREGVLSNALQRGRVRGFFPRERQVPGRRARATRRVGRGRRRRGYSSTKRGIAIEWRVAVRPSLITPR